MTWRGICQDFIETGLAFDEFEGSYWVIPIFGDVRLQSSSEGHVYQFAINYE